MKRPLKLFGNEFKEEQVYFIHVDGIGYWFLSKKAKLAGERDTLREVSKRAQKALWSRSWLIAEIVTNNEEALKEELYGLNPTNLEEAELEETKQDNKKLKQALEDLVRDSLSGIDLLYHPVISKYATKFTDVFLEDNNEYENAVVLSAFAHRLIVNEEYVSVCTDDPEKGVIKAENIFNGTVLIGQKVSQDDLKQLDEKLLIKIFEFCETEFNGEKWLTTKDKEVISETKSEVDTEVEEKKISLA